MVGLPLYLTYAGIITYKIHSTVPPLLFRLYLTYAGIITFQRAK